MKKKLYALDAFFIEKLKLSENDPNLAKTLMEHHKHTSQNVLRTMDGYMANNGCSHLDELKSFKKIN